MYQRFMMWLSVRPSGRETVMLITWMFVFKFLWSVVVGFIVAAIAVAMGDDLENRVSNHPILNERLQTNPITTGALLLAVVVAEEFFFRYVPLMLVLALVHFWPLMRSLIVPMIFVSGIAFGLMHVMNFKEMTYAAVMNALLIQGVAGILLAVLFMKYCGLELRRANKAFFVTTLAHASWNAILIALPLVFDVSE